MVPNPIHKVLSTLQTHGVQCLLMGGQACVYYGAAEFSRDTDVALLAEPANLARLRTALDDLRAVTIAVPSLSLGHLRRGHAVHFRCGHPEAEDMRLDVMSVLRGLPDFRVLWSRRTTAQFPNGVRYELMSLPDLVIAKKTQRDKDWPMIRRLVEADYIAGGKSPSAARIVFWLREARTPGLLSDLARRFPNAWEKACAARPLLRAVPVSSEEEVARLLRDEEESERARDRVYWTPLRAELERLRHRRK